jgi:hypothetical protein
MRRLVPCLTVLAAAACHADAEPDAGARLSTGPIVVPAGVEGISCWWFDVDEGEASAIVGFASRTGPGVHHLSLFIDHRPGPPPPPGPCVGFDPGWEMIYTAGGGTGALELPAGVGLPLGHRRLVLQGHFTNFATHASIETAMEVELRVADLGAVAPAGLFVMGTTELVIPPYIVDHVVTARCRTPPPVTFVHAFPHMHERGTRVRLSAVTAAGPRVLVDSRWSLATQPYLPFEPAFAAGEAELVLECFYDNPTEVEVRYGESARDEMCQVAIVAHPLAEAASCFHDGDAGTP